MSLCRAGLCRSVAVFNSSPSSQILIEISEASSVITWDFDVCKGDVVFHLYHSRRAPAPPAVPRREALTLGAHAITSPGANNAQLIERSWVLGRDYSMVQTALTCKEGESVQVRERRRARERHLH